MLSMLALSSRNEVLERNPFCPKEIDGMLVPLDKASTQLTDHLITG